jgi:hypothetical protein
LRVRRPDRRGWKSFSYPNELQNLAELLLDDANGKCKEQHWYDMAENADYEEFHGDIPPFNGLNLSWWRRQAWLHYKAPGSARGFPVLPPEGQRGCKELSTPKACLTID